MEEIICYDKGKKKISSIAAIVECAERDMTGMTKIWTSPQSDELVEHYSDEKLEYLCFQVIQCM